MEKYSKKTDMETKEKKESLEIIVEKDTAGQATEKLTKISSKEKISQIKEGFLHYVPFDPEAEVKKISSLSKEEKKEGLEKFKEEYKNQRIGILGLHRQIEQKIEENPDIPREELDELIFAAAERLRLSPKQFERMSGVLDTYERVHQKVTRLRAEYPNDADLFEEITGKKPKGHLEVIQTPITLHFMCEDFRDFAHGIGYRGGWPWQKYDNVKNLRGVKNITTEGVTFEKLDLKDMLASKYYRFRYGKKPHLAERAVVTEHEMRHQVFEFFKNLKNLDVMKSGEEQFYSAIGYKEKKTTARMCFKNTQIFFADAVGEDILNTYVEERREFFYSHKTSLKFLEWYGARFLEKRDQFINSLLDDFLKISELQTLQNSIDNEANRALYIQMRDIEKGVETVRRLESGGFSESEILDLLGQENLKNWPKVAERILRNRRQDI